MSGESVVKAGSKSGGHERQAEWPKDRDSDLFTALVAGLLVTALYCSTVYLYRQARIGRTTPQAVLERVRALNIEGLDLPASSQTDQNWQRSPLNWLRVNEIEEGNKRISASVEALPAEKFMGQEITAHMEKPERSSEKDRTSPTARKRYVIDNVCEPPWFRSRLLGIEQWVCYVLFGVSVGVLSRRRRRVRAEERVLQATSGELAESTFNVKQAEVYANREDDGRLLKRGSAIAFVARALLTTFHRSRDVHASIATGAERMGRVEGYFESSLSYVTFSLAAIPTIGFEGTVRGLTDALAYANSPDNLPEVVGGLSIAFDSTFMALIVWLLLRVLQDNYFRRVDNFMGELHVVVSRIADSLKIDFTDRERVDRFLGVMAAAAEKRMRGEELLAQSRMDEDIIGRAAVEAVHPSDSAPDSPAPV